MSHTTRSEEVTVDVAASSHYVLMFVAGWVGLLSVHSVKPEGKKIKLLIIKVLLLWKWEN